ncbi:MAG: DUF1080 domain-containing protein [Oscillochloris sp.]|nr:DUF1080 domain-containing protein [Oscillochloris sp.]
MKRSRTISLAVSLLVGALVLAGVGLMLFQAPQGAAQEQGALLEYPEFPPTPTIGPNPTIPAQLASAAVVLASSDFSATDALSSWQIVDQNEVIDSDQHARWIVEDGRLVQDYVGAARNPTTQETAALTGDASWADYTVRVNFYDEANGTTGLIARHSGTEPDTASYYRFRILKTTFTATPKLVLEKVVDGVATTLAQADGPGFTERTWHTLALTVQAGNLTVTLDGTAVATATDPSPLSAGQAGVYTRALGGILFDDFAITTP